MLKLNAKELREHTPSKKELSQVKRNPLYIIIENVLDTYNVGSIFRLADAAAVTGVYLVGKTDIPTDPKVGHKIQKASVGTWKWVPWYKAKSVEDALLQITKSKGQIRSKIPYCALHVIAIEQHKKSVPYMEFQYQFPIAFIVGHETTGVSDEALALSDHILEIPMYGVNKSLNVMVSLAIVMWRALDTETLSPL